MAVRKGVVPVRFTLHHGNCLDVLPTLPRGSVDLILADPPYGTTSCKWDSVIPFVPMWVYLNHAAKAHSVIALMASQPFTSALVMSNPRGFSYDWVWEKPKATGHLNSRHRPMVAHESVLIFGRGTYVPQKVAGTPYVAGLGASAREHYGDFKAVRYGSKDGSRMPRSVLKVQHVARPLHPSQKPVALMEYFIRTYTNPGDTVLDFTMGVGTTGVACANTGRKFIGIELDANYFAAAQSRVSRAFAAPGTVL